MKKNIETLLETFNLDEFNPEDTEDVSKVITKIIEGKSHNEYFGILNAYIVQKKALKMSISDISKKSGIPVLTIKRFENLQNCPNVITLINLLHAIGLKILISPLDGFSSSTENL